MRYSNGVHIAARCVFLFLFAAAASSTWVQTAAAATVPGDVNGDGVLSLTDAAMIRAHLLQSAALTGDALVSADADSDGNVTLADVVYVNTHLSPPVLPVVSSFSINDGASLTTSRNVTLNNTCTGSPTQYMASESATFSGAS